jgi:hypothetical protein
MTDELLLDRLEVTADGFEDLRQIGGDRDVLCRVGQWKTAVMVDPQYWSPAQGVNALSRCSDAN